MEPILYKTNKKKVALMFGIFAVATPLSAIAAYFVPRLLNHVIGVLPILIVVLVYVILVVSLLGLVAGLMRLISNKFDLRLDEKGIHNNAEVGTGRIISWSNIERVSIQTTGLNQSIAIFLKDPQTYIDSFSGLKKQGVGLLNVKYGTPCVINIQALRADTKEVEETMKKFLNVYGHQ
jgi:hypothetical protein